MPTLLDFLLQVSDLHAAPELIALVVNLTTHPRCAEVLCDAVVGADGTRGFDALA